MKKLLPKLLLGAAGVWVGSMLIYWFNLDNKAIYFLVRPLLDKLYDHRKVDERSDGISADSGPDAPGAVRRSGHRHDLFL